MWFVGFVLVFFLNTVLIYKQEKHEDVCSSDDGVILQCLPAPSSMNPNFPVLSLLPLFKLSLSRSGRGRGRQ